MHIPALELGILLSLIGSWGSMLHLLANLRSWKTPLCCCSDIVNSSPLSVGYGMNLISCVFLLYFWLPLDRPDQICQAFQRVALSKYSLIYLGLYNVLLWRALPHLQLWLLLLGSRLCWIVSELSLLIWMDAAVTHPEQMSPIILVSVYWGGGGLDRGVFIRISNETFNTPTLPYPTSSHADQLAPVR